jgi:gephyrin
MLSFVRFYSPSRLVSVNQRLTNADILVAGDGEGVYPVLTAASNRPYVLSSGSVYRYVRHGSALYTMGVILMEANRVNTGGPIPHGSDAVVMVEDTEVVSTVSDGSNEEREIKVLAKVDPGENTRKPGSDVRKGEKVLEKGTVITRVGGELGSLAFVGRKQVLIKFYFYYLFVLFMNGSKLTMISARSTFIASQSSP